jgi:hypothetical protein
VLLRPSLLSGLSLILAAIAFAQTSNTVVGTGYSWPVPVNAAPGQILNLYVHGVGSTLTQRVAASGLPLPTQLAGISVTLTQTRPSQSVAVPIVAVRPMSTCISPGATNNACGHFAVVTVQIPFELVPSCQPAFQACPETPPGLVNATQLVVSENGTAGGAIDLNPKPDQIHIVNACDVNMWTSNGCAGVPTITHADGSLVWQNSPAHPGEEIVIYAFGLGATKPSASTGAASPAPAAAAQTFQKVNYEFAPNAGPSKGLPLNLTACATTPVCPNTPAFAGLTPGQAGLYQVNFVVPAPSRMPAPCDGQITSNLTLTLVGQTSFDGAGICVAAATPTIAGVSATPADTTGH